MAEARQSVRRPIQTSSVIVLNETRQGPVIPPPSPPTPCVSPSDGSLSELSESFSLGDQRSHQPKANAGPRCHGPSASSSSSSLSSCSSSSSPSESRLRHGLHVLNTEAAALANLTRLYETDPIARDGFDKAVEILKRQGLAGGKLVVVGVGKSGHIGKKLVATMQSLDIRAVFLHPTEALHGDLGVIDTNDTLMFITYSGKTQELMLLLPHLNESLPTILLTSHIRHETCELIRRRPNTVLLPAPIPESETTSFGVPAPSTSTTVALALGDALAITAANEMHHNVAAAFARNHPGGAIGAAAAAVAAAASAPTMTTTSTTNPAAQTLKHLCVSMHDIPSLQEAGFAPGTGLGIDLLHKVVAPSQIRQISSRGLTQPLTELEALFVSRNDMLAMSADTTVRQARDMVRASRLDNAAGDESAPSCDRPDVVIGVLEGGKIVGVLEAGQLGHLEK
ncbi:sugar isomerase, KpsF/GutQ [Moelleriella libera RCEF 2490]|uniref:Sugar isomerase, KpsF/GutQ n=1 Tax=Moelleriella libera RCEF 2490 TaxID=1081109 RepID=A0A166VMC1_9HYPO|nr:sugar isomerase, KpsF/GutQ [Moelleriella libera RCEF 2490]